MIIDINSNEVQKTKRISAGELSKKAFADTTKYNALEVGHAMVENIAKELEECIETHLNLVNDDGEYSYRLLDQFTVVIQGADDPLIKNAKRRKFYCCPFLPSPRPDQAVFLYQRGQGHITKRLWVLPSDVVMAELASLPVVDKRYKTMQAWSIAFFEGKFWDYIRYEHDIKMVSQEEFLSQHREELVKAGCNLFNPDLTQSFDFNKIQIKQVIDS